MGDLDYVSDSQISSSEDWSQAYKWWQLFWRKYWWWAQDPPPPDLSALVNVWNICPCLGNFFSALNHALVNCVSLLNWCLKKYSCPYTSFCFNIESVNTNFTYSDSRFLLFHKGILRYLWGLLNLLQDAKVLDTYRPPKLP